MASQFQFDKKIIFGWIVHIKKLSSNDSYTVNVSGSGNIDSSKTGNITLWTEGNISGINLLTGEPTIPRYKGYFSLDRESIPTGNFKFTANQDSEWICINFIANKRRLPKVKLIRAHNSTVDIKAGSNILFCSDNFSNGNNRYPKFHAETFISDAILTCDSDGLILLFEEIRNASTHSSIF